MSHTPEEEEQERFKEVQDQIKELIKDSEAFSDICYRMTTIDNESLFKLKELEKKLSSRLDYIEKHYLTKNKGD